VRSNGVSCGSSQADSLRKVSEGLAKTPHQFSAKLSRVDRLFDRLGDENTMIARGANLLSVKRVRFEFREVHFSSSLIAASHNENAVLDVSFPYRIERSRARYPVNDRNYMAVIV
jgi:hypothetical protein